MSTPENKPANDPDQSNDDGLDLTTPNDNQELDRINDAVQAAEPSFTLNYESNKAVEEAGKDKASGQDGANIKQ